MFMLLISVLSASFLAIVGSVAVYSMKDQKLVKPILLYGDFDIIGEALEAFYRDKLVYPASLSELASTPGYEYINAFAARPETYGYYQQSGLTTSSYQFKRASAFALQTNVLETSAEYAVGHESTCGTGTLSTSLSWCGRPGFAWTVSDNRPLVLDALGRESERQQRTISKLRRVYRTNGTTTFPTISPTTNTLPALVGYTGTKANCAGAFRLWTRVALDCTDLYSHFGQPVSLTRVSSTQLTLTASAGSAMMKADGTELKSISTMTIQ